MGASLCYMYIAPTSSHLAHTSEWWVGCLMHLIPRPHGMRMGLKKRWYCNRSTKFHQSWINYYLCLCTHMPFYKYMHIHSLLTHAHTHSHTYYPHATLQVWKAAFQALGPFISTFYVPLLDDSPTFDDSSVEPLGDSILMDNSLLSGSLLSSSSRVVWHARRGGCGWGKMKVVSREELADWEQLIATGMDTLVVCKYHTAGTFPWESTWLYGRGYQRFLKN